MSTLIAEWAQREPGGVAFFREKGREGWQRGLFMEEAMKANGEAFLAGLEASGPGWKRIGSGLLAKIAEHAPGRFVEMATLLPPLGRGGSETMRKAFEKFAFSRPEKARSAAEALSGQLRVDALAGVAMAWARTDGKAALAWVQSLEEGEERSEVARAVLLGWAKEDPAAALDRLGELPAGGQHDAFASTTEGEVLRVIGESDFEAALTWIKENPGKIRDSSALSNAVDLRLTANPEEFLSGLNSNSLLGPMLQAISSSLLNDSATVSKEVAEWAFQQKATQDILGLRNTVLSALSYREPKEAISLVEQMAPGEERERALAKVVSAVTQKTTDLAVFDIITKDVSPEWQSAIALTTFSGLSEVMFVTPSAWVERLGLVESEERPRAVHLLTRAWAQSDINASLEWVDSLENSAESVEGTGGVAVGWFSSDPEGAGQWASELDGAKLDAAASAIAERLAEDSQTSEALGWLSQVESVDKVYEVLDLVSQISGDEALQWIEQSHFAPEQKEALIDFVEDFR